MTASPDLWVFFVLVFGVIVLPGMDMAYVATSAALGGVRAGSAAVAGIVAGGVVHVAVASTGLAMLLTLWPAAFDAVLVAGAIYMAWIGWGLWRAQPGPAGAPVAATLPRHVFGRAMLTCLLNPKAYAFMLAVFPAFLNQDQRPPLLQSALLAAIIAGSQLAVYGSVAALAASSRRVAGTSARTQRWLLRGAGPLLIGGAVAVLALGWR